VKGGVDMKMKNLKHEVARELGIELKKGYNGDLKARDAGRIGGGIVKKVFEDYKRKAGSSSYPN
jgi:hypothetical protein